MPQIHPDTQPYFNRASSALKVMLPDQICIDESHLIRNDWGRVINFEDIKHHKFDTPVTFTKDDDPFVYMLAAEYIAVAFMLRHYQNLRPTEAGYPFRKEPVPISHGFSPEEMIFADAFFETFDAQLRKLQSLIIRDTDRILDGSEKVLEGTDIYEKRRIYDEVGVLNIDFREAARLQKKHGYAIESVFSIIHRMKDFPDLEDIHKPNNSPDHE